MSVVVAIYISMSVITFVMLGFDKRAARRAARNNSRPKRVPESTLHVLELLGGFPGTLVAQQLFRHKIRKAKYLMVLWLIIALHAALWLWWYFAR